MTIAWRGLPGFASLKPFPQRLLGLARPTARRKAVRADILIQIRPVDSRAPADEAPVGSLRGCPVEEAREPGQWHNNGPAVGEIGGQRLVANSDAPGERLSDFNSRNTHALRPEGAIRSPQ